jgi:hypothetical protein
MPVEEILRLGPLVDARWKRLNYDDDAFPDLAFEALDESGGWSRAEIGEIVDWFTASDALPAQFLDGFGQPNLRVFMNHKFRIELLFWFEGTTSIHEHGFSGAFGVVNGSSVHSAFAFEPAHRVCRELHVGRLVFRGSQLLERGAHYRIRPGSGYIHSLYHLDYPSVSLVIRTHEDLRHQPQLRYARPGLAEAAQYDPYPHKSVLALLDSVARAGSRFVEPFAVRVVGEYDILTAFRAARAILQRQDADEQLKSAVRAALGARDAQLLDMLLRTVESDRRERAFLEKRRRITDPDHRFMLALLLNVPDRNTILSLVAQRYPGIPPAQKAFSLLVEMAGPLGMDVGAGAAALLEAAIASDSCADFVKRVRDTDERWSEQKLQQAWSSLAAIPGVAPLFSVEPPAAEAGAGPLPAQKS